MKLNFLHDSCEAVVEGEELMHRPIRALKGTVQLERTSWLVPRRSRSCWPVLV